MRTTVGDCGWHYAVARLIPFAFCAGLRLKGRTWLLGLFATFLSMSILTLVRVNPPDELGGVQGIGKIFLPPAHFTLMILSEYGLGLLAASSLGLRAPQAQSLETS